MKYQTILVTGGAGFIGSNLALSFKKKYPKIEVIVLDNLKRRGSELNLPVLKRCGIGFMHADIRNPEDLALGKKIDLLLECSAEPSVLAGFSENPLYIINTNLAGTINCLELARRDQADLIFLSTSRVYPYAALNRLEAVELETRFDWEKNQDIRGLSREGIDVGFTLDGAKTLYGATKLASELILGEYIDAFGIKGVINRCGVVAGPGQFGRVDQGVVTYWMLAHYFKRSLKYIGFDAKGKQVRDILHVDDLFDLIDLEIRALDKINGRTYNVGGGRKTSISLLELTQLCDKITSNHIKIGKDSRTRPGDIRIYLTDNRKVNKDLGWSPKKTPEEILRDIHQWIRENEGVLRNI